MGQNPLVWALVMALWGSELWAAVGMVVPLAGTGTVGTPSPDGLPALSTQLYNPSGIAVDSQGNVFYSEQAYCIIRRIDAITHLVSTVVGGGSSTADNVDALAAKLYWPQGIHFDGNGKLLICDSGSHRVLRWDPDPSSNMVSTVASVSAVAAAADSAGNVFAADPQDGKVWRVDASTKAVTTFAGGNGQAFGGDGGPAAAASLNYPSGVAVDGSGDVFIADQGNFRVREVVAATGKIVTVAGDGFGMNYCTYNNVPATETGIGQPVNLALTGDGGLLILSDFNMWRLQLNAGTLSLVVGDFSCSSRFFAGVSAPADSVGLGQPQALDLDSSGNVFIALTSPWLAEYVPPTLLQQMPADKVNGFKVYHGIFRPGLDERCDMALNPPAGTHAVVEVYNAIARRVRVLFDGPAPGGTLVREWDGKDDGGSPLPSGTYAVRYMNGDGVWIRRVVLVR